MAKLTPESAWEFADAIKAIVKPQTTRRKATVQNVDKDGTIWVNLPGSSTVTPIQSTGANVSPGDTVLTELRGTSLHITENQTNPAIGEKTARSIARQETEHAEAMAKQAQTIADEAQAVAEATNQHFFADDNGAHITDVTQDEWTQAVADEFSDYDPTTKPYHNQLLNSLGILLRTALNNLVSITRSAIAFYDGQGNNAANIVARFGSAGAQIGRVGSAHAEIQSSGFDLYDPHGFNGLHVDNAGSLITLENVRGYRGIIAADGFPSMWVGRRERGTSGEYLTRSSYSMSYTVDLALDNIPEIVGLKTGGRLKAYFVDSTNTSRIQPASFTIGTAATDKRIYGAGTSIVAFVDYDGNDKITLRANASIQSPNEWYAYLFYWTADVQYYGSSFTFGSRVDGSDLGDFSSVLGLNCEAGGDRSLAAGMGVKANSDAQTVVGQWNIEDTTGDYALIIGNGTADNARSNALAVTWDGDIECATDTAWITLNGTIKYRIHHGVCYVCGDSANGGTSVGTSGTNVGTLPVEARPSVTVNGAASTKSNAANGQFSIDSSGVIKVWNLQTSSPYWCFTAAFPVG